MNNVLTLAKLFSQRLFSIPDYQRGYSWDKRQRDELLEDLELLQPERKHYTGTVVLKGRDDGLEVMDIAGRSYTPCELVDGQQRLTSVVLLLAEIARRFDDIPKGRQVADGIRATYLFITDEDEQRRTILGLNEDCQEFWIRGVLAETPSPMGPEIQAHQRLLDARSELATYLDQRKKRLGDNWETWLRELHRKCTQGLMFTLYAASDRGCPGLVTEIG